MFKLNSKDNDQQECTYDLFAKTIQNSHKSIKSTSSHKYNKLVLNSDKVYLC